MTLPVRLAKILSVLGFLAVAGGSLGAYRRFAPRSPVVRGLFVGEARVPDDGGPSVEAWLRARGEALRARSVRFRHEAQIFETTLDAAGVTLDVEATLAEARKVGHEGSTWTRVRTAERARRGEIEVPLVWTVDEPKARALLASYAPPLARAPVDARIDLTEHRRTPDEPGRALDADASLAGIVHGRHRDGEVVDLLVRDVQARVMLVDLTRVNIEDVVSAYETTFSLFGTGAGRAVNIRNAAGHLDGIVLGPGQLFSFNDVVGARTRERGFALAPEIQGDELQLGYGGGTCQVSSTLHAAALFGALEIIERTAHSRPSSYAPMGLDATVSYPGTDLRIRNSLPYPVMIHAFFPRPTAVRIELLGGHPVARVDYVYGVNGEEDFMRRLQIKPGLMAGQRVLHQKGIRGFDVTSLVRLHYLDGREDERRYYSGYRPTPEIYWIAPGYDLALLPPLPEHAKGVEGLGG
jgi:vancomycin resistance protein YoaR